jgi:hypothetical protein
MIDFGDFSSFIFYLKKNVLMKICPWESLFMKIFLLR